MSTVSNSDHYRIVFDQQLLQSMQASIGGPSVLVVPYAMYIYFGLDLAPGSLSSYCALLIAFGFPGWLMGSMIGLLNAKALVYCSPEHWFQRTEALSRCAALGSCACFTVLSFGLITDQLIVTLLSPAMPAICAATCLWLNQQAYEDSPT